MITSKILCSPDEQAVARAREFARVNSAACWVRECRANGELAVALCIPGFIPREPDVRGAIRQWVEGSSRDMPSLTAYLEPRALLHWQQEMYVVVAYEAPRTYWRMDEPNADLEREHLEGAALRDSLRLGDEDICRQLFENDRHRTVSRDDVPGLPFEDQCRYYVTRAVTGSAESANMQDVWTGLIRPGQLGYGITEARYAEISAQYLVFLKVWREFEQLLS